MSVERDIASLVDSLPAAELPPATSASCTPPPPACASSDFLIFAICKKLNNHYEFECSRG